MKNRIIPILILSLTYLGIHYLLFAEVEEKWGPIAISLAWGISFHILALRFLGKRYIFSESREVEK